MIIRLAIVGAILTFLFAWVIPQIVYAGMDKEQRIPDRCYSPCNVILPAGTQEDEVGWDYRSGRRYRDGSPRAYVVSNWHEVSR